VQRALIALDGESLGVEADDDALTRS
jgi:hypothetical protein